MLPIQPTLTPAMGISGVLLLMTGLAYTVIGIKNKMVYVAGSAAYLTTLAVTVLIIYLMNPPVSDAVQGAFFVAAFFTGVIFGVISLVFADITEGFGCLLGGFCLSMWFLSLKDGGLISSATGRAIFIGCFSAGGYALSFSHYTRTYGLIGSIAFSGATATILGIDCLARSGWKEFWLYIWNLNEDIFPLDTNTYPVTKNIKAELAGVVIIAVFGVVSQLRVWKIVKEHREKSAAQQLEKEQDKEREEEALGRKIEDNLQRERAQWEAAYGNGNAPESSPRSSLTMQKGSMSVREKEMHSDDSVEMVTLNAKDGMMRSDETNPKGTTVTVSVLREDEIQQIDAQGAPIVSKSSASIMASDASSSGSPDYVASSSADSSSPNLTRKGSLRPSAPPPPPSVVPLPFTIPQEEDAQSEDEDRASVSAVPETVHMHEPERRRISKRISDMSATMRQRLSRAMTDSQEALIDIPHIEDDRESSVAATLDDEFENISTRELSPPHSPLGTEHDRKLNGLGIGRSDSTALPPQTVSDANVVDSPKDGKLEGEREVIVNAGEPEAQKVITPTDNEESTSKPVRQSLTVSTDPKAPETQDKRASRRGSRNRADTLVPNYKGSSEGDESNAAGSEEQVQTGPAESHVGSLRDGVLNDRLSKVALSYRTNEWAKHLEAAEKPEVEEISTPSSPGVILEDPAEETPAPVHEDIVAPFIRSKRDSRRTSVESRAQGGFNMNRSASRMSSAEYPSAAPTPAMLSRSNSGTRLDVLSPLPGKTLMSQRESMMKTRVSSQSLTLHSSAANLLAEGTPQDEMTLAERKQLLQHQNSISSQRKMAPSASQKWQNKMSIQAGPKGFDSHQPKRTSSSQSNQRREELYAGWRDTMRDVNPPQTAAYIAEQQRKALLNERRQKEMEKQQREQVQRQRASQMDTMMRSGQMLDAHREAMRRMQANANKHA